MHPVPNYPVTTAYGIRGYHWSCRPDASGQGIHTGADMAAPNGATVVAARPGVAAFVNYGTAFGTLQLAIRCDDGTEDFYAHMSARTVTAGARVAAGDKVGLVGSSGNVTGPHLHFERHTAQGYWSCSVITDPAQSINYQEDDMPLTDKDVERIADAVANRTNMTIGDYASNGEPREGQDGVRADVRLRNLETKVERILDKL